MHYGVSVATFDQTAKLHEGLILIATDLSAFILEKFRDFDRFLYLLWDEWFSLLNLTLPMQLLKPFEIDRSVVHLLLFLGVQLEHQIGARLNSIQILCHHRIRRRLVWGVLDLARRRIATHGCLMALVTSQIQCL